MSETAPAPAPVVDYTKPVRFDGDIPVFLPLPVPEPVNDCPVVGEDVVTTFDFALAHFYVAAPTKLVGCPGRLPHCRGAAFGLLYHDSGWVRVRGAVAAINGLFPAQFKVLRQKEERRMEKARARRAASAAREHQKFCQRQAEKATKQLEAAKKAARAAELRWRAMP